MSTETPTRPRTDAGFTDEHFFLSNFYEAPVEVAVFQVPRTYLTGEHLFQAYKTRFLLPGNEPRAWLSRFIEAPTPAKAKYAGRSIPIDVAAWDAWAENAMKHTLWAKFTQHPELAARLVETGEMELVEINDWNDRNWGVDRKSGQGQNRLGQLLMKLRGVLKEQAG